MKTYIRIIALAVAGIFAFGCSACKKPGEPTPRPQTAASIYVPAGAGVQLSGLPSETFVDSVNGFTAAFMQQMGEDWTGVISPISLQLALTLLANGADDAVCADMLTALGFEQNLAEANLNAAKLMRGLIQSKADDSAAAKTDGKLSKFNMANAVLTGKEDKFTSGFKNIAADYFNASIGNIDFTNPDEALRIINEWASGQTNGLVDRLFNEIPSNTSMALLSAVYFHADWQFPFTAFRQQSKFHGTQGDTSVTMLNNTGEYRYGSFESGEMILLPYAGNKFYMAVVLPKEGKTPSAAMGELIGKWDECTEHSCEFSMPGVSLGTNFDAKAVLSAMGLADAANGNTIFSSVIEGAGIRITQIVHGAHINVTAAGTEAGAASGIIGERNGHAADIVMHCDRPYAMAIVDAETGAVIFISVVNNIDAAAALND